MEVKEEGIVDRWRREEQMVRTMVNKVRYGNSELNIDNEKGHSKIWLCSQ